MVGFDCHIAWFGFLLFAFCVLFTPIFCPFKFCIWSDYCFVRSPFLEAQEISSPLKGRAVPSHRTCILVTGLLRKPCYSPRKRPVLVTPGCDTPCVQCTGHCFFLCLGEAKPHLSDVALTAHASFIFPF